MAPKPGGSPSDTGGFPCRRRHPFRDRTAAALLVGAYLGVAEHRYEATRFVACTKAPLSAGWRALRHERSATGLASDTAGAGWKLPLRASRRIVTILNVAHDHTGTAARCARRSSAHAPTARQCDLRLIDTSNLSPAASVRWVYDVFGNSVAIASFASPPPGCASSNLRLETYDVKRPAFRSPDAVATRSSTPPTIASISAGCSNALSGPPIGSALGAGLRARQPVRYVRAPGRSQQRGRKWISYQSRETEGTQTPSRRSIAVRGCRDFAVLLIEAARSLGFGARVVTGYLYCPATDGRGIAAIGAGSTHAWADIYVPGSGWIAYDPTNATIGGSDLIRVAVTRDISQAVPVAGRFVGTPDSYLGMTVDVAVVSEDRGRAKVAARP